MRVMSLFSGYGGLDHGLLSVVEGEVVAVADVDPGACRLLAHRYPGVPNLGDVTKIDWRAWSASGCSPSARCSPLSSAQGWRGRQTSGSAERQKAPLAAGGEAARGASSDRQKNMANI